AVEELTPEERALDEALGVSVRARRRADRAWRGLDEVKVSMRYNPCGEPYSCDAPEHEVFVYGMWWRVFVKEANPEVQRALAAWRDEQSGQTVDPSAEVLVWGKLSGSRKNTRRVEWRVFVVYRLAQGEQP
ncbi:MAG: hypothetical protein AAGI01_11910, partial [Myxococcota bacterium]